MSDITDFIAAAVEDKPTATLSAFSAAIEPKLYASLENKKQEILSQLFNKTEEEGE